MLNRSPNPAVHECITNVIPLRHSPDAMNKDRTLAALNEATEMHAQLDGRISLDTLFLAAYLDMQQAARRPQHKRQAAVPIEFKETVQAWAGQSFTSSEVHRLCYGTDATNTEAKQAGTWLRELNKPSRRSGGRTLFDL